MWDAIKNKPSALKLCNIADKVFSFDYNDCKKYNFSFLPLFYLSKYSMTSNWNDDTKYDISFIGTVHSDRYDFVQKIIGQVESKILNFFIFFYSPSKILYKIQKYFYKHFRNIKDEDISFTSLSSDNIIDIIKKSKIIIDIERPGQNGLTMRTIEILGANRKLITSNDNIKFYDIYHPNNVLIVNRKNPLVDLKFINSKYQTLNNDTILKYELKNWLLSIFGENQYTYFRHTK